MIAYLDSDGVLMRYGSEKDPPPVGFASVWESPPPVLPPPVHRQKRVGDAWVAMEPARRTVIDRDTLLDAFTDTELNALLDAGETDARAKRIGRAITLRRRVNVGTPAFASAVSYLDGLGLAPQALKNLLP